MLSIPVRCSLIIVRFKMTFLPNNRRYKSSSLHYLIVRILCHSRWIGSTLDVHLILPVTVSGMDTNTTKGLLHSYSWWPFTLVCLYCPLDLIGSFISTLQFFLFAFCRVCLDSTDLDPMATPFDWLPAESSSLPVSFSFQKQSIDAANNRYLNLIVRM